MDLTRIGGPEYASRANGPAGSDPAETSDLDQACGMLDRAHVRIQQSCHVSWPFNT